MPEAAHDVMCNHEWSTGTTHRLDSCKRTKIATVGRRHGCMLLPNHESNLHLCFCGSILKYTIKKEEETSAEV